MKDISPKCSFKDQKLRIRVVNEKDVIMSTDYSLFIIRFEVKLSNPGNYITAGTSIDSWI